MSTPAVVRNFFVAWIAPCRSRRDRLERWDQGWRAERRGPGSAIVAIPYVPILWVLKVRGNAHPVQAGRSLIAASSVRRRVASRTKFRCILFQITDERRSVD